MNDGTVTAEEVRMTRTTTLRPIERRVLRWVDAGVSDAEIARVPAEHQVGRSGPDARADGSYGPGGLAPAQPNRR
jgi:hypothetical protein